MTWPRALVLASLLHVAGWFGLAHLIDRAMRRNGLA